MTAALIFLSLALLLVAALLARQVGLTRNANERLAEWRRRYEQSRRDGAALLSRYRELGARAKEADPRPSGSARRAAAAPPEPQKQATPRPARTPAATTGASAPRTLVLPVQLLSKNARDKLHYRARHKLRRDYEEVIRLAYPRRGEPPRTKQRVTVTRVLGPRERPFDGQNVGAGSAVELIDALTACGFWVDDAPRWLETAFEQGDRPGVKGPAVVVEIEPFVATSTTSARRLRCAEPLLATSPSLLGRVRRA